MLSRSRDIIRSATVDRVRSSKGLQALCLQLHLFSIRQRLCLVRYVDRRRCKIYYDVVSHVKFIESIPCLRVLMLHFLSHSTEVMVESHCGLVAKSAHAAGGSRNFLFRFIRW